MTILALDPARVTGWAQLEPGGRFDSGTKRLGTDDMKIGPMLRNLDLWLNHLLVTLEVTHLFYEQPWVGRNTNQAAALILFGIAGQIEVAAFRRRVIIRPTLNGVFIHHFVGRAPRDREKRKARTIEECRSRGFDPADDNQADAIALLDFAIHDLRLEANWPAGPLFAMGAA